MGGTLDGKAALVTGGSDGRWITGQDLRVTGGLLI
jgi:hypothetical protein